MKLRLDAIANHPDHIALYKLTIAGVGFMHHDRRYYEFFSHEGDFIGRAPTYRVQAFVAFMRRNFGVNRCDYPCDRGETAWHQVDFPLTYGFHDLVEYETIVQWMHDLWQSPITLH